MPRPLTVHRLEDRLTPAGWLDPTWGVNGIAAGSTGLGGTRVAALLSDGGAVTARSSFYDPASYYTSDYVPPPATVTRLLPGGAPDPAFGTNGTIELPAGRFGVVALAAGPANTVYVLGSPTAGGVAAKLLRLTPTGQLDPTFDADGVVEIGSETLFSTATGMTVRPDGGVIVQSGFGPRLAVISAAGGFDPATGLVTVPAPAGMIGVKPITRTAALADGGLLTVTTGFAGGLGPVTLVSKLTAAGKLDTAYGTGGQVILAAVGTDYEALPAADGTATLVIRRNDPDSPAFALPERVVGLAKLTAAGRLDTTYGGDGVAELDPPAAAGGVGTDAVLLPDGRALVLTAGVGYDDYQTLFARVFAADGRPDAAVADGQWLALSLRGLGYSSFEGVYGVGADGRVVLTGSYPSPSDSDPYWAMTTNTAVLDLTAGTPAGGVRLSAAAGPVDLPAVVTTLPAEPSNPWPVPPFTSVPPLPPLPPTPDYPPGYHEVGPPSAEQTPGGVPAPTVIIDDFSADGVLEFGPPRQPVLNDLNGDGTADRVVTDGPTVSVLSGADGSALLKPFAPFEASYTGPLNAVLADADGDGRAELVVSPDQGGGPVVAVYRADGSQVGRFFGIEDANFRGGVRLAAGDVNADGVTDLVVTAGDGGGPRVAMFDGRTLGAAPRRLVGDFFAFEAGQRGGAFAAFADGELVFGAGPGGAPRVRTVSARDLLAAAPKTLDDLPAAARRLDQFVGDPEARRGAKVAVRPTGSGYEVVADLGDGRPVSVFTGVRPIPSAVDPLDVLHGTRV